METNVIHNADIFDKLPEFDDNSLDAIVTDPPYNLKFMGKSWDDKGGPKEFQEWNERWASIAYDKLKPGGYMIVFSGTKTYHRMVSGVEDAGFEIKDMIEWMYGTGFPKSYNISKGFRKTIYQDWLKGNIDKVNKWEGWGTALKPAHEPLVLAQKPREGTYCNNVEKYGCGGLNIDECRAEGSWNWGKTKTDIRGDKGLKEGYTQGKSDEDITSHPDGRFPANLALSHHPDCKYRGDKDINEGAKEGGYTYEGEEYEVEGFVKDCKPEAPSNYGKETVEDWDCVPSCPVRAMNEQSGETDSWSGQKHSNFNPYGGNSFNKSDTEREGYYEGYDDKGGAARYFNQFHFRNADFFRYTAKASKSERTCDGNVDNDHPTVKPLELMEWLVRLVTPPEGVVVDPFCGSGTTLIAAYEQGFDYIGIEKDEDSVEIARERLDYHQGPKQKELV